jgi:hypothetical protein
VIERLFQRLATAFGNQWLLKWQGVDMNAVYEDWAADLDEFSLAAIGYAIEVSRKEVQPPNVGEFAKRCAAYVPPQTNVLRISKKITPEEQEANKERLRVIKEMLAKKMSA